MMHLIDSALNRITMYRLVLYVLIALLVLALVLSLVGLLPFVAPLGILSTTALFLLVCWGSNILFAKLFRVSTNEESAIITALILALIAGPVWVVADPKRAAFLAVAGVVAIASKYLLAIRKQHVFNPAALGIFVSGIALHEYSSWWVGNPPMLPLVIIGGLLVLRKINRFRMVGLFLGAFAILLFGYSIVQLGMDPKSAWANEGVVFLHTAVIFFAVIMFTEPLTSPKAFWRQAVYAVVVAFFFLPQLTILGFTITPELALLIGNVLSYLMLPNSKYVLALRDKQVIGKDMISFAFDYPRGLRHKLGQYLEWTLPHDHSDSRGNRRYFSIASSPTEGRLLFAARFYEHPSSYKRQLAAMNVGDTIVAADLAGDFTLPRDPSIPLAFIAGGIGITPFRSMVRYLVDRGERRSVKLLYSNYGPDEILFRDLFDAAGKEIGMQTAYTLTDLAKVPQGWCGRTGFIDQCMIEQEIPDYRERRFMISGSLAFVERFKKLLTSMGVHRSWIKTDFFPGYSG